MDKLKSYVLGIATIIVAIPILEQVTEVCCSQLETLKGNSIKKTLIINKEIAELQEQLEPTNINCIGFDVPSQEYYDEEEDCRGKNKIGFTIR
jgi:hypothetical protein